MVTRLRENDRSDEVGRELFLVLSCLKASLTTSAACPLFVCLFVCFFIFQYTLLLIESKEYGILSGMMTELVLN